MKNLKNILCLYLIFGFWSGALAHHDYDDYNQDIDFVIQGHVTIVKWVHPHVVLNVQTEKGEEYEIDWQNKVLLARANISEASINVGDKIEIIGFRHNDPSVLNMTLIKEISIPDKNWRWKAENISNKND